MKNITDENGHNQIFAQTESTLIRLERRCNWMIEEMGKTQSGEILEIGCGTGRMSYLLATKTKSQVTGSDISYPFINQAQEKYKASNLEYTYLDFNNPEKLNGKQFDFIVGNGILHHLYYELDNALIKIKELLKPGGKMIFMEPNIVNPYCALIFKNPYFREKAKLEPDEMAFSKSYIEKKLTKTGYKNINVKNMDFLLPGIPDFLIKPSIIFSDIADKTPILNMISQSIFIVGSK